MFVIRKFASYGRQCIAIASLLLISAAASADTEASSAFKPSIASSSNATTIAHKIELTGAQADAPILTGILSQGSLIRGSIQAGASLWLNDQPVNVSEEGKFVFGFGRDAKLANTLKWQLPGSQVHETTLSLSKRQYDVQRIEGVAQKYVSPAPEVLSRIRQDNQQIAAARAKSSPHLYFMQDFILPAKGRISGVYGSQRVFNGTPKRPHFGLDIAGPVGTPVLAPADAVISLVHKDMYYSGGTLIMDHGMGVSSTFIHLSEILVTEGQVVKQGQVLGKMGATGRVTGPHLDWRINWYKERLDPALLLP